MTIVEYCGRAKTRKRRFFLKADAYLMAQSENYGWLYRKSKGVKLSRKAKKYLPVAIRIIEDTNEIFRQAVREMEEE
ncbi:MAG: hypothetical protein GY774_00230 [Planctomycetes bacterium]|nr:hypothetical protein [Planctomycetota bacterium]